MATQVQRRRGTTTEHSTFTGAPGELTVDTTKKTVVVHDGSTPGGFPLQPETALAAVATSGSYTDLTNKPSIPAPADAAPLGPGTAAVGTSTEYAREDHVHPLPGLVTSTTAGLAPASGGGTTNFLRADGTWTAPPGATGTDLSYDAATRVLASSTGGGVTLPLVTTSQAGLARSQDLGDWFILACSDETTALTTGTNKVRFRMPYAGTLTAVRASVNTAPTGAALVVDINEAGTSVLSTKLTIDATELTSTTAASAAVISDSALADDAVISIDIDQIGSTVAGAGLKVGLFVVRS
jgi:hypothetical protein